MQHIRDIDGIPGSSMNVKRSAATMPEHAPRPKVGERESGVPGGLATQGPVSVFPAGWRRLLAVKLFVFAVIGIIYGAVPGLLIMALLAGSISIDLLADLLAKFEVSKIDDIPRRFAVLVVGLCLRRQRMDRSLDPAAQPSRGGSGVRSAGRYRAQGGAGRRGFRACCRCSAALGRLGGG